MSGQRPRVTASSRIEAISDQRMCDQFASLTPSVEVSVAFDLHDHEAALSALEAAVKEVRAQIEEAS